MEIKVFAVSSAETIEDLGFEMAEGTVATFDNRRDARIYATPGQRIFVASIELDGSEFRPLD